MSNNNTDENIISIVARNSRHDVVKIRRLRSLMTSDQSKNKRVYVQICIGSNIARQLEWKDGDSIDVDLSSTKNFVLLKNLYRSKYEDSEYWPIKGYIFRKIQRSYSYSVNLPFSCMSSEDLKIKLVDHEVIDENGIKLLKVYLNGKREKEDDNE